MSEQPLVYAIVLAWNQLNETLDCLESLYKQTYSALRIVLADNGSTDGTMETVATRFPSVEICRQEKNAGISGGYNLGIEYALRFPCEYILVMNNDTVADREMVAELVSAFQDQPTTGMVTPKIYHYYNDQKRLWCVGAKWRPFPPAVKTIGSDALDGPKYERYINLEFATSCCLMMSRASLEKVGLFDPAYFIFFDDWDLSARYRAHGYSIFFVPKARLWHKVSVSTKKTGSFYYMGKSSARFYLIHKSSFILILHSIWFVLRECAKMNFSSIRPFLSGVQKGVADYGNQK